MLLMLLLWRLYAFTCALLVLNAASRCVFKPGRAGFVAAGKALLFTPFWPLAVFSAEGRSILFAKLQTF